MAWHIASRTANIHFGFFKSYPSQHLSYQQKYTACNMTIEYGFKLNISKLFNYTTVKSINSIINQIFLVHFWHKMYYLLNTLSCSKNFFCQLQTIQSPRNNQLIDN